MPGQRAAGQRLVPVPMKRSFVAALNAACEKLGYDNRSRFIREAVMEKLGRMGYKIEPGEAAAPGRTRYPMHRPQGAMLNDTSSKPTSAAGKVLRRAVSGGGKHSASK